MTEALSIGLALRSCFAAVFIPILLLTHRQEFSNSIFLIMTWSGPKDGMFVALALSLPDSEWIPMILAATYIVIIFSIIVQGIKIAPLSKRLGRETDLLQGQNAIDGRDEIRDIQIMGTILTRCDEHGVRMTNQRRVIASVLEQADDHPDVEELYARVSLEDSSISIATVYRTVKLFEEAGILDKHEFGDGRARYEDADRDHHDHLIDLSTGEVIEFMDEEIEALQEKIAQKLGYTLKGHRMELYGVPLNKKAKT